jgi:glyoxylase-like metal-dependent hydrolase (beta-lactamase superfamily II)
MKEIVSGVWIWSWFSPEKGLDFNGFYVRGSGTAALVDPPAWAESDRKQMERLGRPEVVLVTNRNHTRRSRDLAARFGIPVRIHEADARAVDPPLDGTFRDGDDLPAGLRAITLSGLKSPGETALHVPASDAMILGDALIGRPPGELSLLAPPLVPDAARAREGLRRLLDCPFDALLVGDGVSLPRGGRAALERFLAAASPRR